nr:hypothetical protein [uncultured Halomonas sp.]
MGTTTMAHESRRLRVLILGAFMALSVGQAGAGSTGNRLFNELSAASPSMPQEVVFRHANIIPDSMLDDLRGGFSANGLDMSFGATLRTMIDDIRLETVMNISQAGADIVSQNVESIPSFVNEVPSQPAQASVVGPNTGQPITALTPRGINLAGLENFSGLVVEDAKGFSAALHNLTQDAILSTVVSNASGRDIRQQLDIRLDIHNMEALRAAQTRTRIANSRGF